jgi:hypothetical protein
MDFLVSALKRNPEAVYADLKAKADEKKLPVYPIMFGRAKALLGLVKSAKRGTGKAAKAAAARARAGAGAPGRKPDPNSKSGQIRALLGSGMGAGEIAKKVGCTRALVYSIKSAMGMASKTGKRSTQRPRGTRGPGRPRTATAAASASLNGLDGIPRRREEQRAGPDADARGARADPGGGRGRAGVAEATTTIPDGSGAWSSQTATDASERRKLSLHSRRLSQVAATKACSGHPLEELQPRSAFRAMDETPPTSRRTVSDLPCRGEGGAPATPCSCLLP